MNRETVIRYGGVSLAAGAVGGMVGFFARGGWTAEWVGAIGTWVGSLGAVAAIVWAVHSFRLERDLERAERADAAVEAEREIVREAQRIATTVAGGGGHGRGPGGTPDEEYMLMTSARVRTVNNTSHVVVLLEVTLEDLNRPELTRTMGLANQDVLPGRVWEELLPLEPPLPAYEHEMSGQPLRDGRRALLVYRFDGRTWRGSSDGSPPERIE